MADRMSQQQHAGRIGGLRRSISRTNEEGRKAAAQAARMARYDAQIPPEITDEQERARLRNELLRLDMARLGMKSAMSRRGGKPASRPEGTAA